MRTLINNNEKKLKTQTKCKVYDQNLWKIKEINIVMYNMTTKGMEPV